MKSAFVVASLVLMALALVVGAPTGSAQDDPGGVPTSDQETPAPPCPPAADVSSDPVMDGNAAPACPPASPTDIPPAADTPTDIPTAVPTDTPVPTSTPVPVPTATPLPAPTDTPTPMPAAPTQTPTSTSASKDVPVGTLLKQLPFANPGETQCDFHLDLTGKQECDPQTFPAVFTLNFSPPPSSPSIKLQVDDRKPDTTTDPTWDFLSVPGGIGAGTHTITASETVGTNPPSAKLTLQVRPANSPHILVYPRAYASGGGRGKIYLAGYPGSTTLALGIYRENQNCTTFGPLGTECYDFARDLGTIKTNADGTVIREFSVPANEKPAAYLVVTSGMQISADNTFDSVKSFGRPWFVVSQP